MLCDQLVWTVVEARDVHTLESQYCEFCLCDNRWHSVHAVMADGRLSLRVDTVTVSDALSSSSLGLNAELFIGGLSGMCALPSRYWVHLTAVASTAYKHWGTIEAPSKTTVV